MYLFVHTYIFNAHTYIRIHTCIHTYIHSAQGRFTALHYAAMGNHSRTVEWLLAYNAFVSYMGVVVYVCMYIYIYIYIHTHTCFCELCVYVYIHIRVCVLVCM